MRTARAVRRVATTVASMCVVSVLQLCTSAPAAAQTVVQHTWEDGTLQGWVPRGSAVLTNTTDVAHTGSWLQFGGLGFVLSIVATHVWLVMQPLQVIVAALMLVVAGIASRNTPMPIRIASATYLFFFLAVGQSFNTYWAYLVWPTWSLASGFGAHELLQGIRHVTQDLRPLLSRPRL